MDGISNVKKIVKCEYQNMYDYDYKKTDDYKKTTQNLESKIF